MTPEFVIVTIRTLSGGFEGDYELPANLPAERLSQLLLESLAHQDPRRFGSWKRLCMVCGGWRLEDSDTLSARGIWDGGILMIEEES